MVLSDYAFSSYDQGPPSAGGNSIATPSCGAGSWQCEQRWPSIAGMVGWHNAAGAAPVANWWTDGSNAIAFSRGSAAWVAINAENAPVTEDFSTGLPAGTYCDVITGAAAAAGCTDGTVTVNAAGQATVTVPAMGAVGIDVAAVATAAAVAETVTVTVPAGTDASGDTVYLAGNLSVLGLGQSDWAPTGIPMTRLNADYLDRDHRGGRGHHAVLQIRPGRQLEQRGGDGQLRVRGQPQHGRERRHGQRYRRRLGRPRWLLTGIRPGRRLGWRLTVIRPGRGHLGRPPRYSTSLRMRCCYSS